MGDSQPLDVASDPNLIAQLKEHHLYGDDTALKLNVGHFVIWFGGAEMYLTRLLAYVLDYDDMSKFNMLVKGMDARVKCERLRKASKRFMPMGPVLSKDLKRFEEKSIPLRNRMSHSWTAHHDGLVYFCHVERGALDPANLVKDGTEISYEDLFLEGMWLCAFTNRLSEAWDNAMTHKYLEVGENTPRPPQKAR